MVFQDPPTSLNPVLTIGQWLTETIRTHLPLSEGQATERALALLAEVEIPQPEWRLSQYLHQLSGGMRQCVAIALALCADPCLLIADDPPLRWMFPCRRRSSRCCDVSAASGGLSAMLITYDMGVIAETADRVMVMYGGRVLETGPVRQVLQHPRHRYTRALMAAIPSVTRRQHRLPVPGVVPSPSVPDDGSVPQSQAVLDDPQDPYTRQLLAAIPSLGV